MLAPIVALRRPAFDDLEILTDDAQAALDIMLLEQELCFTSESSVRGHYSASSLGLDWSAGEPYRRAAAGEGVSRLNIAAQGCVPDRPRYTGRGIVLRGDGDRSLLG